MSKKPNIRRKKMNVITEALLYSCCQKEPVFILNYPIMAGYQLARCIIQKILSFSVQPKVPSWSIWSIKCNSACWIFPVLFLLTWHCRQQLKFFQECLSFIFWIFDVARGTTGCYNCCLLISFAVVPRSSNKAQNTTVLRAVRLLFSISPKPRLTGKYLSDCKKTELYYLAKIGFQIQVGRNGNISFLCSHCQPTCYGLPTFGS